MATVCVCFFQGVGGKVWREINLLADPNPPRFTWPGMPPYVYEPPAVTRALWPGVKGFGNRLYTYGGLVSMPLNILVIPCGETVARYLL